MKLYVPLANRKPIVLAKTSRISSVYVTLGALSAVYEFSGSFMQLSIWLKMYTHVDDPAFAVLVIL